LLTFLILQKNYTIANNQDIDQQTNLLSGENTQVEIKEEPLSSSEQNVTKILQHKSFKESKRELKEEKRIIEWIITSPTINETKQDNPITLTITTSGDIATITQISIAQYPHIADKINSWTNIEDLASIVAILDEETLLDTQCQFIKEKLWPDTIIDSCKKGELTIRYNNKRYVFQHQNFTISSIKVSDPQLQEHIQKLYSATKTDKSTFTDTISAIIKENPQSNDPKQKIIKTFQQYLGIEPFSISQRGQDFMVWYKIGDISFVSPYSYETDSLNGLFFNEVIINGKPLVVKSFTLTLSEQEKQSIETFKTNPLIYISTFYPSIEEIYNIYK